MWEQDEFARHWKNEFPDGEVPQMDLNSVEDIESELDICKSNLKRLQKALAEEKFKVIYLQTTMARQKKLVEVEGFEGKDENSNTNTGCNVRKPLRRDDERDGGKNKVSGVGGVKPQVAAITAGDNSFFSRERGRFSGKAGIPVPIPVPPEKPSFRRDGAVPIIVPQPIDKEESSDREYEDPELNENFVKNNLLAPKSGSGDNLSVYPNNRRPLRHSRDMDSGDEGGLSFPHLKPRASRGSGCSTPDQRSDGYLSSDHDDCSSAGKAVTQLCFLFLVRVVKVQSGIFFNVILNKQNIPALLYQEEHNLCSFHIDCAILILNMAIR